MLPSPREIGEHSLLPPIEIDAMADNTTEEEVEEIARRIAGSDAFREALLRSVGSTVDDLVYGSEIGIIGGEQVRLSPEQDALLKNTAIDAAIEGLSNLNVEQEN